MHELFKKYLLSVVLYSINLKLTTVKIITDSVRNFLEGFVSFYTVLYKEIKNW
jgi:hypothetical protein